MLSNVMQRSKLNIRVVPDIDLAGYPANNFAGYRISGLAGYQISGYCWISGRISNK